MMENIYDKVNQMLLQRQHQRKKQREDRLLWLEQTHPELEEKRIALIKLGFDLIRAKGEERVKIEKDLIRATEEFELSMNKIGKSTAYLEGDPICEICQDHGEINGQICSCKRQLISEQAFNMHATLEKLEVENFQTFDINRFSREMIPGKNMTVQERMETICQQAIKTTRAIAKGKKASIIFYGAPGTGKTFICNAMAKELIEKGIWVIYITATQLTHLFSDMRFGNGLEEKSAHRKFIEDLKNVDVLFIDDLGAEAFYDNERAEFFELINHRSPDKCSTIISTNLLPEEWKDFYEERIQSRFFEYKLVEIIGEDLRKMR